MRLFERTASAHQFNAVLVCGCRRPPAPSSSSRSITARSNASAEPPRVPGCTEGRCRATTRGLIHSKLTGRFVTNQGIIGALSDCACRSPPRKRNLPCLGAVALGAAGPAGPLRCRRRRGPLQICSITGRRLDRFQVRGASASSARPRSEPVSDWSLLVLESSSKSQPLCWEPQTPGPEKRAPIDDRPSIRFSNHFTGICSQHKCEQQCKNP